MRYEKQPDGLSQQQLGAKLRKMGVRSKPLRYGKQGELIDNKQRQLKGYDLAWFKNLFERQLAGRDLRKSRFPMRYCRRDLVPSGVENGVTPKISQNLLNDPFSGGVTPVTPLPPVLTTHGCGCVYVLPR